MGTKKNMCSTCLGKNMVGVCLPFFAQRYHLPRFPTWFDIACHGHQKNRIFSTRLGKNMVGVCFPIFVTRYHLPRFPTWFDIACHVHQKNVFLQLASDKMWLEFVFSFLNLLLKDITFRCKHVGEKRPSFRTRCLFCIRRGFYYPRIRHDSLVIPRCWSL